MRLAIRHLWVWPIDVQRTLRSYPRGFWIVAVLLVALGTIGSLLHHPHVALLGVFMSPIFLITTLCELATCVLLAVIFFATRRWELQPLVILYLAGALLEAAAFASIRLPGRSVSLIAPGNTATPWLFAGSHIVLAVCVIAYALRRAANAQLSVAAARRTLIVWFPAAAIVTVLCIVAVITHSGHQAVAGAGEHPDSMRQAMFRINLCFGILALVAFVRILAVAERDGIDYSVLLTIIASDIGLCITMQPNQPRYGAGWVIAQLLYGAGATFVLIAAIRYLLDRLGASLRAETNVLRLRATTFEQNALVEASLVKSRFVATVSHELRTPLGGIIGMAELLECEPLTGRQARFAAAIRSSANLLFRVVNDLLDFSRAESGRIELEDAAFELEQTIHDVVVLFSEQARLQGLGLHAYVDPAAPRTVNGDETRLKQVLHNLVGNAIHFTSSGTIRIEVVPQRDARGALWLQFAVHDTGIGIAPQSLERIFDAFVQADPTTARRFGGTGLGLSIARHLVELMGGELSVRSKLGAGSTFSFTLPAKTSVRLVNPPRLNDTTVLVVEPDAAARVLLLRYVAGWSIHAVAVATCAEARITLAAAPGDRPFTLLIAGSGVSADDAQSLIRRDPAAAPGTVPAAAILIRDDVHADTAVAGYDTCLCGPLRQSELFDAIARLQSSGLAAHVLPRIAGVAARRARRERVLVAEDNEVNQMLMIAQLEHLGFAPDLAVDGTSAVDAAAATAYDLIFMDCQMPQIDGFEATRRIRASTPGNVPIVAVTANVLAGYRETCMAAGMSDYLAKPALIGPLTEIVDRWLPIARPETSAVAVARPATVTAAATRMRERLGEVFHGDQVRIDRVLKASFDALHDGLESISVAIAARDVAHAGRTAHRLKGVALEIGRDDIAARARGVQTALEAARWDDAETALADLRAVVSAAVDDERANA